MTAVPKVTAVVVSYNQSRWLPHALASVSAQTRPPDQVIVIDDGSRDASPAIAREWAATERCDAVLILRADNRGVTRTLNEAFARATGDVIAPLAADDLWLPSKLAVQTEQWARLPHNVGALYGDVPCIDEDGAVVEQSFIATYKGRVILPEGDLFAELLQGNFLPSPSLLLRTDAWRAVGGFDESLYMEDWDFWLRLSRRYTFAVTPRPVGKYRVVAGSHVRGAGREVLVSHLRTFVKWSHTPEMRAAVGVGMLHGLSAQLYASAGSRAERRELLGVWLRHGGWGEVRRGRWITGWSVPAALRALRRRGRRFEAG